MLDPIRERDRELTDAHIDSALESGAARARARIRETTLAVKEKMGL